MLSVISCGGGLQSYAKSGLLVGMEDPTPVLDDGMGVVLNPSKPHELEQRLHALAVGSPLVRRVIA
jgi:hypothetical protein